MTNYHEVARHVGLDPYAMLGRAGLNQSALQDPENWLPAENVLQLLEESSRRAGRDDFSVLLAETRTLASLGPVSLLVRHEATLGQIIRSLVEYRQLMNELLVLVMRNDGHGSVIEWNLVPGLRSSQGVNLIATVAYRVLVDGAGINWQPDCIHFRHARPTPIEAFKRVFRCPLEFDSGFDGISFDTECLALPNKFADPALTIHARRLLDLLPAYHRNDTAIARTRSTIPMLLSSGQASAADVAELLGMTVRTLQRRLIREGQSFSNLLNETRRELAVRYLGSSTNSITSVAHLTGFSALSSFTRWFASEFGMSPAKWREVMRRRDALHIQQSVSVNANP